MIDYMVMISQIIIADIILSGDNALVIAMAAAGVDQKYRKFAIIMGLAMAAILRIVFAVMASILLQIPGILFFGGLLLCWVCWRFYQDIRGHSHPSEITADTVTMEQATPLGQLKRAMIVITVADVSMSIDNVVVIAAIARDDILLMIFGIALAIAIMALCATVIMKILTRFPILAYAGLLFLIYISLDLLYEGGMDLIHLAGMGLVL
ncbi:MAG: YjbE family putative metal transport protein [Rhodobacteraceae bacterium]|nr:YjbE family putative metal transport protein [Paracoccaceae bacterium]MCY4249979.1 YjbE family putative metal transport protein [Paracoccaceae bacterium]